MVPPQQRTVCFTRDKFCPKLLTSFISLPETYRKREMTSLYDQEMEGFKYCITDFVDHGCDGGSSSEEGDGEGITTPLTLFLSKITNGKHVASIVYDNAWSSHSLILERNKDFCSSFHSQESPLQSMGCHTPRATSSSHYTYFEELKPADHPLTPPRRRLSSLGCSASSWGSSPTPSGTYYGSSGLVENRWGDEDWNENRKVNLSAPPSPPSSPSGSRSKVFL